MKRLSLSIVVFCALASNGVCQETGESTPAQQQLKAMEPLIGTWVANDVEMPQMGLKKGDRHCYRFEWCLRRSAVIWKMWNEDAQGENPRETGMSLIGWDRESGKIASTFIFVGGTSMQIECAQTPEGWIFRGEDGTRMSAELVIKPDGDTMSVQMVNIVSEGERKDDGSVTRFKREAQE